MGLFQQLIVHFHPVEITTHALLSESPAVSWPFGLTSVSLPVPSCMLHHPACPNLAASPISASTQLPFVTPALS
jgi:hypothetical protein